MADDQKDLTDAAEANMEDTFPPDVDTRQSPADGEQALDELTLDESESQVPPSEQSALAELRATGKPLPPDRMSAAIRQFFEQRAEARKLMRAMMAEGVHWGYPPGLAPKIAKQNGVDGYMVSVKNKRTDKWEDKFVAKTQYTRTPSLYKAGAEIICDLFAARPEYGLTVGAKAVTVLCRLYSEQAALLGEGHGADSYGSPSGLNKATKMAEKRALVNAVLDTFHLSDLFTQDLEDLVVEPYNAPAQAKNAPNVPPRGETPEEPVAGDRVMLVFNTWTEVMGYDLSTDKGRAAAKAGFPSWVQDKTEREFNARKSGEWRQADLKACEEALP